MRKKKEVIDTKPFEIIEDLIKKQMEKILLEEPFHFGHIQQLRDRTYLLENLMRTRTEGGTLG